MPTSTMEQESVQTFEIRKQIDIDAPIDITWGALLDEIGPENQTPDGTPFPLKIEPWPGGRWYRDLDNNAGHLWGLVQVIKPPALLEITGPMPMSYPAVNHIQYRLTTQGSGTELSLTHKAMGLIIPEHRDGMPEGWDHGLQRVREIAESRYRQ